MEWSTIKNDICIDISLLSFLERSNMPWSIKNNESRYLFINKSALKHYGIPLKFDYQGLLDNELPHFGAEFASEYQKTDKVVVNEDKVIIDLEPNIISGKAKKLQPHICEKQPLYDEENRCIAVICQGRNIKNANVYCSLINSPATSLTTNPPTNLFTKKELEVIFFLLQKLSSKEIAKNIGISYRTVENKILTIYNKIGINSSKQLREYCIVNGINSYMALLTKLTLK